MTHLVLAQNYARLAGNRLVWVYDKGQLVLNSPFQNYARALEAISQPRTRAGIRRTIDTGKLFLGRYTFYSSRTNIT